MPSPNTHFTADLHLDTVGVLRGGWGHRPYDSCSEHNQGITDNINDCVMPRDRLVILGDHAYAKNALDQARVIQTFMRGLKCKNLVFVNGNHDYVEAMAGLGIKSYDYVMINWEKYQYFCCHYPMLTWPASHKGSIHCYGHTHAAYEADFDRIMPERRSLDTGLENAYRLLGKHRPFAWFEIVDLLKQRKGSFAVTAKNVSEANDVTQDSGGAQASL